VPTLYAAPNHNRTLRRRIVDAPFPPEGAILQTGSSVLEGRRRVQLNSYMDERARGRRRTELSIFRNALTLTRTGHRKYACE
jgi:hypothetical protein